MMGLFDKWVKKYGYEKLDKSFMGHDARGHKVEMTHITRVPYGPTVFAGWCEECEAPWLILESLSGDGSSYEYGNMEEVSFDLTCEECGWQGDDDLEDDGRCPECGARLEEDEDG